MTKYTLAPGEEDPDDEGASIVQNSNGWELGNTAPMNATFTSTANTWSSEHTRAQWSLAQYRASLDRQQASNTLVIGMGGLLRSGKDTVADYLVTYRDFVKLGMSDALADALYILNPWVEVAVEHASSHQRYASLVDSMGYVKAKTFPDARAYLQLLGTEVGRNLISENVWVDIIKRRIDALTADGKAVVVTGIRYKNELDMIAELNGVSWWVDRADIISDSTHSSENSVTKEDFDAIIPNHGSRADLYVAVEDYLDTLKGIKSI